MSDAHEIIRLAIVGSGANFGSHAAATRVLAALPKLIDDAMVERAVDPSLDSACSSETSDPDGRVLDGESHRVSGATLLLRRLLGVQLLRMGEKC